MHSSDKGVFAETIIVMAHKLGLKVIAEGVETVGQRDWLKAMKCDYAQGFFFSEAVPSVRFTEGLQSA
jgi:EAL domain-containing protein (putative c-di-GMP-specific phosphodiesterase class I)